MREILFKAKRIDNGEWVEGLIWKKKYNTDKIFISCFPDKDDYEEVFVVDKNTICQYTGLTDKNGNKIWENDIVYIPYVCLEDTYCKVVFQFGQFVGELIDGTTDSIVNRKAEVIGNIFDNEELLKGGAE